MNKKIITVFLAIVAIITVYAISILIPKKQTYSFTATLALNENFNLPEPNETAPIFGDALELTVCFDSKSVYNTYYDNGYVIINGEKYYAENSRYYPRSFAAKLKHEWKYFAEMIKYKYDLFWFNIEHESGYTVTVGGHENGSGLYLYAKKDDIICFSYE